MSPTGAIQSEEAVDSRSAEEQWLYELSLPVCELRKLPGNKLGWGVPLGFSWMKVRVS